MASYIARNLVKSPTTLGFIQQTGKFIYIYDFYVLIGSIHPNIEFQSSENIKFS